MVKRVRQRRRVSLLMDGRDAEKYKSLCPLVRMMCLDYVIRWGNCAAYVQPPNLMIDANIVLVFQHVEVGGRVAAVGNNKSLLVYTLEDPIAKGAHARSQDGDDLQVCSWFLDVQCARRKQPRGEVRHLLLLNPYRRKGFIQHPPRILSFSGVVCTKC